jgi:hypothetical protein
MKAFHGDPAESNHYRWEAKTLLELLRAAPQEA